MLDAATTTPYQELATVMADYLGKRRQGLVVDTKDYAVLKHEVERVGSRSGDESWPHIWAAVELYLDHCVNTAHPQYFNQLWAGQSEPALVGGVIELLANTSMYTFEVAPVATAVENEMRTIFAHHFGLDGWESQVTTGGSNSNFLALLLALQSKFPDIKNAGLSAGWRPRVYVSKDAHYSFDKAVMMAGLGLDALIKVPVDGRGAMSVDALNTCIEADLREGFVPCLIAGTAGTTVRGAFDPFNDLATVAIANNCWFHIDGAWGGAIHYASDSKRLLGGTTLADSFSWDAHKMLGVPLMCSLIFVKQRGLMSRAFQLGDTSYIYHDSADSHDLGPASLQCGRRVDMLKMWFEYLFYGEQGFRERIYGFLDLAAYAERRVEQDPSLELQATRWINNICFRSHPPGMDKTIDLNAFNAAVRQRLKDTGRALVNQAYIDDELTIRLVIANKEATTADISRFFDLWTAEASRLASEWQR